MKRILNLLFSIACSLMIITGAVKFTVEFKELYYWDIRNLNISKITNMTEDELTIHRFNEQLKQERENSEYSKIHYKILNGEEF